MTDEKRAMDSMIGPVPPPPRWATVAWAVSPAAIILAVAAAFGRDWPYLSWVAFLAGVMNMFVFSAYHLLAWRRGDWLLMAIPLTLVMLLGNALLVVLGGFLLGIEPPADRSSAAAVACFAGRALRRYPCPDDSPPLASAGTAGRRDRGMRRAVDFRRGRVAFGARAAARTADD